MKDDQINKWKKLVAPVKEINTQTKIPQTFPTACEVLQYL